LSRVLRLHQHNIGYTADGFYRSDDPTNSVKALKPLMSQTTSTTTIHIQLQTVTLHDLN